MTTYHTADGENMVVVHNDSPVYATYARGSRDALYRGYDEQAARESLGMSDERWAALLMSDADEA